MKSAIIGTLERELKNYYDIVWDERETHKFKNISPSATDEGLQRSLSHHVNRFRFREPKTLSF